jgi:hypothetical protein
MKNNAKKWFYDGKILSDEGVFWLFKFILTSV